MTQNHDKHLIMITEKQSSGDTTVQYELNSMCA